MSVETAVVMLLVVLAVASVYKARQHIVAQAQKTEAAGVAEVAKVEAVATEVKVDVAKVV